jgi:polyisoprenoid-binding protein YceI
MKKTLFTFVIASFIFFSCNNASQQKEDNTEAQLSSANGTLPDPAPLTGDKVYTLLPGKTSIKWFGAKKLTDGKHNGSVLLQSGELAATNGMLSAGKFIIDMTTIHSIDMEGNPKYTKLVGHLKSDDFFDVEKFPTATLEITSVQLLDDNEEANATVYANLTIKEATHNISFPASVMVTDEMLIAKAKFSIDRSKWNVRYGSESFFDNLGDGIIKNEIDFEVNFSADLKQ